jgi:hypothetical protein
MLLLEREHQVNAISREQFRSQLSAGDLRLIEHLEARMERLFQLIRPPAALQDDLDDDLS